VQTSMTVTDDWVLAAVPGELGLGGHAATRRADATDTKSRRPGRSPEDGTTFTRDTARLRARAAVRMGVADISGRGDLAVLTMMALRASRYSTCPPVGTSSRRPAVRSEAHGPRVIPRARGHRPWTVGRGPTWTLA